MVGLVQHVFSNTVANVTGTITIWHVSAIQQTIAATNVVRPQDWNSTHNMSVTLTGNTAFGNTSVVGGTNIIFRASGGIMFSGNSAGSSIGLGLAQVASQWFFPGEKVQGLGQLSTFAPTSYSLYLYPFYPIPDVSWSNIVMPVSLASSVSAGDSSASGGFTFSFGLYSLSSPALSSMTTNTFAIQYSLTNTNISWTLSNGAGSSTVFSSTSFASRFNGAVSLYIPWNTSVSGGGSYFIGYVISAAGTTASANSAGMGLSFFGASLATFTGTTNTTSSGLGVGAVSWGSINTATALISGAGITDRVFPVGYSAATGAFPASIPIGSNTTNTSLRVMSQIPFFQVVNS